MDGWITLAIGGVVVPCVAWLTREVLALRGKMIELETRMGAKDQECERHQKWAGDLQRAITRMDKNISRLCQKAGVHESE
jgi:hypothetical protein